MLCSANRHSLWSCLSLLAGLLILATVFSACTSTGNSGSNSVKLEATAVDTFFGAFAFSYPAGWESPLRHAPSSAHTAGWREFVPPGEINADVYVLYSRGYDGLQTYGCDLTVTLNAGQLFKS